jgi:hypothetical protein
MLFSVIYSVDVPSDTSIRRFNPPAQQLRRLWQLTEGDGQYDYDYLEGCWTKGKHRKWCALLTRKQFDEFVQHCGLAAEDVQTLGSLGAPGFGYGLSPAISFIGDSPNAIQSAYVTPIPRCKTLKDFETKSPKRPYGEVDWERVRRVVIAAY